MTAIPGQPGAHLASVEQPDAVPDAPLAEQGAVPFGPRPEGEQALDDLAAQIRRYVILPSGEALTAVVLWVAATHLQTEATTKLGWRLEEERLRQRVKEIDAVRQADGDTTPAHTHLAERGEITWQQAHQLAEQHHTQQQENIQRTQQAIEQISANWTAIRNVTARLDTPYAREILEGLTPEAHTLIQGLTAQA